ncbi:MAG: hypothetical protein IPM58_04660 [Nitrospira sp.]|nr:hypothetical protein [Nitrospira sp.]
MPTSGCGRFGDIWLEPNRACRKRHLAASERQAGTSVVSCPTDLGWDTLADRLFKIRHCQDIEGRLRQLPLFDPPIDPGLLVRARAAGIDLRSALRTTSERPHYRYVVMQQKALEFCGEVRALGAALLAAFEKRDAAGVDAAPPRASGRARHEAYRQVEEANESLEALRKSRQTVEKRLEFYASREFMNAGEVTTIAHQKTAHDYEFASQTLALYASILHLILSHADPGASGLAETTRDACGCWISPAVDRR